MVKRWVLAPSILVAAWLVVSVVVKHDAIDAVIALFGMAYIPFLVVALGIVRIRSERDDATYLAMCAQAPMALVPTWADVPGAGQTYALRGFLDSLAESPDPSLIVGVGCLVLCAIIPVVLAFVSLNAAPRAVRVGLVLAYAAAWITGIVLIDALMFFGGILSCCGIWWYSSGALLRVLVFFSLVPLALRKLPTR